MLEAWHLRQRRCDLQQPSKSSQQRRTCKQSVILMATCGVLQTEYANPQELWERSKDEKGSHDSWYKGAVEYWDKQEASYNGVLGGFECVSDPDINDSRQLLTKVWLAGAAVTTVQG